MDKRAAKRGSEHLPGLPAFGRKGGDAVFRPERTAFGSRFLKGEGRAFAKVETEPFGHVAGKAEKKTAFRPLTDGARDAATGRVLAQAHDEGRGLGVDRNAVVGGKKQRRLAVGLQYKVAFFLVPFASVQGKDRDTGAGRVDFFHAGPHDAGNKRVAETAEKVGVHGADPDQLP